MHQRSRRRSAGALGVALLAAAFTLVVGNIVGLAPEDNAAANDDSGPTLIGNEDNTNPVFETVQDWNDLVQTVENEGAEWYKQCLGERIGVTWEQARQYAGLEDQGHDLRFIVISNSRTSDEEARAELANRGFPKVENLPIVRVNGFSNTAGLPSDRCKPFGDGRNQVRVSLGIPVDTNDLSKGLLTNKGVLAMCSNPFLIPPPPTKETTTTPPGETTTTTRPTTSTTQPPTTTTTVCKSGKCEPPTTVAPPPTTAPPRTTTTQPNNGGQGDSGDGATNTTSPPTTQSPPATSPPTTTPPGPPPPPPPG